MGLIFNVIGHARPRTAADAEPVPANYWCFYPNFSQFADNDGCCNILGVRRSWALLVLGGETQETVTRLPQLLLPPRPQDGDVVAASQHCL